MFFTTKVQTINKNWNIMRNIWDLRRNISWDWYTTILNKILKLCLFIHHNLLNVQYVHVLLREGLFSLLEPHSYFCDNRGIIEIEKTIKMCRYLRLVLDSNLEIERGRCEFQLLTKPTDPITIVQTRRPVGKAVNH